MNGLPEEETGSFLVLERRLGLSPWLAKPIEENRWLYARVLLAAALINIFAIFTSLYTMTVYDRVIPTSAYASLIGLTIGLVIIIVFDFIIKGLRAYFVDVAGSRIDQRVGREIFAKILSMRLDQRRGSIGGLSAIVREVDTIRDFMASATITALVDVPFIFLTLLVIALIGGSVVWVPIILIPVVLLIGLALQPALRAQSSQLLGNSLSKHAVLVEAIGSLETVKVAGAGPMLDMRYDGAVERHSAVSLRQRIISNLGINSAMSAQSLCYAGVVFVGVFKIADQSMTMGALIACSILAGRAVAPLTQIAQLLTRVHSARSAYKQIDALMEQPDERSTPGLSVPMLLEGGIEFRDVDFRYPDAAELALRNVNLRINPGEHVALIGPIGSGKSTIAKLITGLYEPASGLVLVDGIDIRQMEPTTFRSKVGTLLQDNSLLTGTIRDNIRLGRSEDDEELMRVSQIAGAHDFIATLPHGYDLRLSDRGEGLSGGQRQSIALARAMYGSPPIMVLDEPTSAIDTDTEAAVVNRLKEELSGRTLILVTHRPSLLALVDRVILMSRGRVVVDGPPDQIAQKISLLKAR
ncbi:type I secretion system permease/ATPase [uncultured Sphingorhabdus sp.]|uniref:type I secretion system permease/ATPase n=1 Tax=uncultured Sphingorhabdus sp. TaxID=1686106 RepID=UPI00263754A3|nr:type I secretion system permease/ATPase [uncultured Sphingorhabdus sp.]HMS21989.1 type I secretion system permease/ATPase [Sphingorhabdus sp.]